MINVDKMAHSDPRSFLEVVPQLEIVDLVEQGVGADIHIQR